MVTAMKQYKTIDAYIRACPKETHALLQSIRKVIKSVAPKAVEAIKYGIPTFVFNENLVHFGGYKTHIGFYPGSQAIVAFKKELAAYEVSKGTVRFPLDKSLPVGLIKKIVNFRVKAVLEKAKRK